MEKPRTRLVFGGQPEPEAKPGPSEDFKPVRSPAKVRQDIQVVSPGVISRKAPDGSPSNGDPTLFENSFSVTDDASGIRYDFRQGLRVMIPVSLEGTFEVTAEDAVTGFVHHKTRLNPGDSLTSRKKWFIPWRFTVRKGDDIVMSHTMDLSGKEVAIHYPKAGLGDTIAWFSYADAFERKTNCNLTVCMEKRIRVLFENAYPEFQWADEEAWRATPFYAVYHMGIFSPDNENDNQPEDFRLHGIHHAAGRILGLPEQENPPLVDQREDVDIPEGPYVCIAVHASSRCKEWLNPWGWATVVKWLSDRGYRNVVIDRAPEGVPNGCLDLTGDIDLLLRTAVLKHAKAFIGVSSGLAWLAWACRIPVVLISGMTLPHNEFPTPYRVINESVCHGCWNDTREYFDHFDADYCPRHRDTPRQHECSRGITPEQVILSLEKALEEGNDR